VELAAADGAGHPWQRGIMALDPAKCPGIAELLQARALEGAGLSDEARALIGSSLHKAPGLVQAVRDAMEYELCAGNWAQAFELASPLGHDDEIAGPLLRPLEQLRRPAAAAERAGRNQPCPCGSGRKYKASAGPRTWRPGRTRFPCGRRALCHGLTKAEVHRLTGIARTTIDRIVGAAPAAVGGSR
jgi:SEC-C motif